MRLIVFILSFLILPSLSWAQDSTVWIHDCLEGNQICQMSQRLVDKDSGARVMEFVLVYDRTEQTTKGVTVMPLGVYLPAGVLLKVDDNNPFKFAYNHCSTSGCTCFHNVPDKLITQMKAGKTASFTAKQLDGSELTLNLSLKDFTKVFEKTRGN